MKTSELIGPALDWAVAKCEGAGTPYIGATGKQTLATSRYSTDWAHGGPIIELEGIGILFDAGSVCSKPRWFATPDDQRATSSYEGQKFDPAFMVSKDAGMTGPTPLIAAMRCYVASKFGHEVDVPEGLA